MGFRYRRPFGTCHAFIVTVEDGRWRPWMGTFNAWSLWVTGSLFGSARLEIVILDRALADSIRTTKLRG